jgi:hypothetical protein
MSESAPTNFQPGTWVHPKRKTGHIANTMLVVDPQEIGEPLLIGRTYVVLAFPNLHLPDGFDQMPPAMQQDIVNRLDAIHEMPTDSLVTIEDKGLRFVSQEWFDEHMRSPFAMPGETQAPMNSSADDVRDEAIDVVSDDDVFRGAAADHSDTPSEAPSSTHEVPAGIYEIDADASQRDANDVKAPQNTGFRA